MNMVLFLTTTLVDSSNSPDIITSAILTGAVFAAIVTSTTNLIVSITNGQRLKKIEKQKQQNEIDKYRYSRLYELILNWHKYDSKYLEESASKIITNRLVNLFLDDTNRYEIAKPLLDDSYKKGLDSTLKEGKKLLEELTETDSNNTTSDNYSNIFSNYVEKSIEFSNELKDAINKQLEILLLRQNK